MRTSTPVRLFAITAALLLAAAAVCPVTAQAFGKTPDAPRVFGVTSVRGRSDNSEAGEV